MGPSRGNIGASLGYLGASWGPSGASAGLSWANLDRFCWHLRKSCGLSGTSRGPVGPSWWHHGAILGPREQGTVGPSWAILKQFLRGSRGQHVFRVADFGGQRRGPTREGQKCVGGSGELGPKVAVIVIPMKKMHSKQDVVWEGTTYGRLRKETVLRKSQTRQERLGVEARRGRV